MNRSVSGLHEFKKIPIFRVLIDGGKEWLLEWCKKYHEIETRNLFYLISQKTISENPSDVNILDGVKIVLLSWNWGSYYQKRKEKLETINQDILNAYIHSKPFLENALRNKKLETMDIENGEITESVKATFDYFGKSMDPVGASKALHTIRPDLFMMWDNKIQNKYHFRRQVKGVYKALDGEDYLQFMRISHNIARTILQETSLDELWREHLSQLEKDEKELLERFSCKETLPKMLDEANYAYAHSKRTQTKTFV